MERRNRAEARAKRSRASTPLSLIYHPLMNPADSTTRVFQSFILFNPRTMLYLDSRGAYGSIANARLFSARDFDDIQHGFRISLNDGADIVPCEDGPYRPSAPISPADLSTLAALRQTVFALESVLMLAGSSLPPAGYRELVKYAESGRATIERAETAAK